MTAAASQGVLLVSMPFGPIRWPSLGLGLLQAQLRARGIPCHSRYFGFDYAHQLGADLYERISNGEPQNTDLVGEWIFSSAVFGPDPPRHEAFVRDILDQQDPTTFRTKARDGDFVASVLAAERESARFIDECFAKVDWSRYAIVGFTSMFQQQLASLALARRIKRACPEVLIAFGGPNCEDVMGLETLARFPFVDVVVSGEADLVFPGLVERVLAGQPVTGLAGVLSREESRPFTGLRVQAPASVSGPPVMDLDVLPVPAYSDFFEQLEASAVLGSRRPLVLFETSRGCWWGERSHCTFCGLNGNTMKFRSKSADRALSEILELRRRHGDLTLQVVDNILDLDYFKTLIPRIKELGLDLDIFYETKSNLKRWQVELLADAGVRTIQPGIESLSSEVLRLIKKGVTAAQNVQLLRWCVELGITPHWNVLFGFPGEDAASYGRLARIVPLLTHLTPPAGVAPVRLDRFSPLFTRREELGVRSVRAAPAYRSIYPFEEATLDRFAYHFVFEGGFSVPVAEYTRPFVAAVLDWQAVARESALFAVRRSDDTVIVDLRPIAEQTYTVLDDLGTALLAACNEARARRLVVDELARSWDRALVEDTLDELEGRGFVLVLDGLLLSLVVSPGRFRLSAGARAKLDRQRVGRSSPINPIQRRM